MTTPINPVSLTPNSATADRNAGSSTAMEGMGKDAFLKLLVAQLKYQNPLSPVDGNEYMAQVAQFAQVEALLEIQKHQQESTIWQSRIVADGLIGKHVTGTDMTGAEANGLVTGVRMTADGPILKVGDVEMLAEWVSEVRLPSS